VLSFLNTNDGPRRAVYPPAHRRAMIQRLYERRRFEHRFEAGPEPATFPGAAQLSVEVSPKWNEASLHVTAYGADLADFVRFRLRELRLRRID
jgi:hypothetical protein